MISKEKGNIGESIVLVEFVKRGIQVSIPFGDAARYDLVADFNGKLNRIQVKYCNYKTENNSVCCPCASSLNHTTNKNLRTYENDVDYIAFYIVALDKVLLVPIEKLIGKKTISFRLAPTKNNQKEKINLAEDYFIDNIINSN